MATIENIIKKGQYLKKKDADTYVHYHFDTDDSIVYLIDKLDKIPGGKEVDSSHYAKGTTLHETLCALYTLASKGGQASTDLATLIRNFNNHINNTDNPHNVTKADVKLGSVVNATMDDAPTENSNNYVKSGGVYTAVKQVDDKVGIVLDIANGQSHAWVFANVDGLTSGTLSNNQFISGYKVGDSIYIIAEGVSDFWISAIASTGTASTDNAISSAKKGDTVVVKWGGSYVSLTALESKRDLNDYITTGTLNTKLNDYYNKQWIQNHYVQYHGDRVITVTDDAPTNPTFTEISKGKITLNGRSSSNAAARGVDITSSGIRIGDAIYDYPEGMSSPLATQGFVIDATSGYQTADQVRNSINAGTVKLKGDVTGNGTVNDTGINTILSNTGITPGTYSALTVDAKGRATEGWQWLVFAPTINDDEILRNLAVGGVAIIDA